MITIEEFKKKQSETSRLIGLDLGSKRIGVSICDERQSVATPFKTINKTNNEELINELKKIIKENNIRNYCWLPIKYGWFIRAFCSISK